MKHKINTKNQAIRFAAFLFGSILSFILMLLFGKQPITVLLALIFILCAVRSLFEGLYLLAAIAQSRKKGEACEEKNQSL